LIIHHKQVGYLQEQLMEKKQLS